MEGQGVVGRLHMRLPGLVHRGLARAFDLLGGGEFLQHFRARGVELFFFRHGHGQEDREEAQQQRDHVRIGHQPVVDPVMVAAASAPVPVTTHLAPGVFGGAAGAASVACGAVDAESRSSFVCRPGFRKLFSRSCM